VRSDLAYSIKTVMKWPVLSMWFLNSDQQFAPQYNKCSKQFGKRPHRRLVTPRGCEWIYLILTQSNTQFLGPTGVSPSPQKASWSVQQLLNSISVWLTHRQTHRPRYVQHQTSNRPHLTHCVQATVWFKLWIFLSFS